MKRSIQWDHLSSPGDKEIRNFVSFPGASFDQNNSLFPYYYEVIQWQPVNQTVSADLLLPEYEDFKGVLLPSQESNLTRGNKITVNIAFAALKPYLQITIFPFRLSPDTRKLQRLKSFIIRLESAPDNQFIKSAVSPASKKLLRLSSSVISSGKWYKIKVPETGIYKLSFDQIKSMGFDDPSKVRIFGCGGQVLPEDYSLGNKDELQPTQVHFVKGADNILIREIISSFMHWVL